jgi:nitrogen-specific signal transduction histidine kinase
LIGCQLTGLTKSSLESYQFQEVDENGNLITGLIDQDSPNGDITVDPEFTLTIEGDTAIVNLAETPIANTRVLIVRKVGKMWQKEGEQLRYTSNSVAEFIRGATTDLPK